MSPNGLELVGVGFDEDGLAVVSDLLFATQPEWDRSVAQMLAAIPLDPEQRRVVAWLDGEAVGFATVGRIWVQAPEYPTVWGELGVLPAFRGQGIGTELLDWCRRVTRERGKESLLVPCSGGRPEGIAFLSARGFDEYDRMACVELPLPAVP